MSVVEYHPFQGCWALQEVDCDKFLKEAPWEERTSARFEAFWSTENKPYTYGQGRGVREYWPKPFPEWMSDLQSLANDIADAKMHLCFLNRYDHAHQHLGWHADDSPEQDDTKPIIVMSFGQPREIFWRENGSLTHERLLLEDRSVFIMKPGMQQTHQHRIPKHSQPCGRRISLTWRALK